MKLGVILFGHLRTFEYCSDYLIKNIIQKYDCDVFMHTWDEIDSLTKSWNNKVNYNFKVDENVFCKVKDLYNPKHIVVEHQENDIDEIIESSDGSKTVSLNGMNYMFKSMSVANELRKKYERENNLQYDYLLVTRPDVAIYNFLDIERIINEAKELNIDIDNSRFFAGVYGNSKTNVSLLLNRINDVLFFAKPSVIDKYISANLNLKKDKLDKRFLNMVSIYTKNEINAGIMPCEICFAWGKDFKNVTFSNLNSLNGQTEIKNRKKFRIFSKYKTVRHNVFEVCGIKIKLKKKRGSSYE